jgi:hypothetical protein
MTVPNGSTPLLGCVRADPRPHRAGPGRAEATGGPITYVKIAAARR